MRTMPNLPASVAPGGTVGILGGGQLGRMLALAAARIGLKCVIFAPEADSPGVSGGGGARRAGYDDHAALQRFARRST